MNFYRDDEVKLFIDDLKKRLNGEHLELLVIDTLAASMVGGNQDWSRDMTIFINNVKLVMRETGCAALVVHHAGWNETSREKGSIDLRGAADVVIETTLGEEQPDGSRIITLTCRKMKSMRKFQPFSMALVPVTIDTPEGSFESLALGDPAATPAAEGKTKEDQDLEDMEFQLECFLGNKATHAAWLEQMWKYFKVKKDDKDKKGWSESTFDRKLKKLKDTGRVTGGGNQGDLYSVVNTPEAERARHGDTTTQASTSKTEQAKPPSAKPQSTVTPIGGDGDDGGFGGSKAPSNHTHEGGDGGSRTDSKNGNTTESPGVVPSEEPDLADEAMKQVNAKKKKPPAA